ncbi:MAG: DNA-deoxyinosine glycosylase [Solobacterium sp.]|jgi:hypoxanthine-DNA glycosylase|nr:DNA-deoxyinosine glycosylase [Solobacterium sp.]
MSVNASDDILVTHSFPELYDQDSKVLILGSFPSVISRKQSFYYANPSNRFWPVLASVYEEEITDRAAFAHRHHLALWDVIASCKIHGSSDTSIHDVTVNDIQKIVDHSSIETVFLTGKKALQLYEKYVSCDLPYFCLPSTSGANAAVSFDTLKKAYGLIREYAEETD